MEIKLGNVSLGYVTSTRGYPKRSHDFLSPYETPIEKENYAADGTFYYTYFGSYKEINDIKLFDITEADKTKIESFRGEEIEIIIDDGLSGEISYNVYLKGTLKFARHRYQSSGWRYDIDLSGNLGVR